MKTLLAVLCLATFVASPAFADSKVELDAKVQEARAELARHTSAGAELAAKARGVLVFPRVIKAGFGVGGEYGEGALLVGGKTVGYYNIASASLGLQIGAQSFSEAIYFMTEDALKYLDRSKGFEIGADANVALANEGLGYDVTSSTVQDPIIAFVFGQQGLMAGLTIEGSKITRIGK